MKEVLLMLASELKGRAIMAVASADVLGHVDDVLFDQHYATILGFRLKHGLLGSTKAVLRTSVNTIGTDAITVGDATAVNDEGHFAALEGATPLSAIVGTRVVTASGNLLGTIGDVDIDTTAQQVNNYQMATSLAEKLTHHHPFITVDKVVQIGAGGVMIVPDASAESAGA